MIKTIIKGIIPPPIFKRLRLMYVKNRIRKDLKILRVEAEENFLKNNYRHGSLDDYIEALEKHWCSFHEYMYLYEFWHLNEKERSEYVCRLQMIAFYRLVLPSSIIYTFWHKTLFLKRFSDFIHREWLDVNECSFNDYCSLVSSKNCIVKLGDSCCGVGIYKIYSNDNEKQSSEYFKALKQKNALIEECIEGCYELQKFHPQSLNTIRVVTILDHGVHKVLHSFFRVGVGDSVIDNAHGGGLFAQVDVNTGIVVSDALSVNGEKFHKHPNTKIEFKGFVIPEWETIKATVLEAAKSLPGLFICGWDVTLTRSGVVEIVEGNHGPDFDIMQAPLKKGYFQKINECVNNVYGKELLELINID